MSRYSPDEEESPTLNLGKFRVWLPTTVIVGTLVAGFVGMIFSGGRYAEKIIRQLEDASEMALAAQKAAVTATYRVEDQGAEIKEIKQTVDEIQQTLTGKVRQRRPTPPIFQPYVPWTPTTPPDGNGAVSP